MFFSYINMLEHRATLEAEMLQSSDWLSKISVGGVREPQAKQPSEKSCESAASKNTFALKYQKVTIYCFFFFPAV